MGDRNQLNIVLVGIMHFDIIGQLETWSKDESQGELEN